MTTKKEFYKFRPRLRAVAPLTFWICLGFAITNVAIWWLLAHVSQTAIKTNPVPIVPEPPAYAYWGYWFLILALGMFYNLYTNNWRWIKNILMLGLASKLIWTYALLFMLFNGLPVFATFILWAFAAYIQAWTIVFFVPTITDSGHVTLAENERFKNKRKKNVD